MTSLGPRWFTGLLKPSNAETFPLDSCASRCHSATCVLYQTSSAQGRTYEEVLAIYHHTSSRAANPHEIPTSKETQLVSKWKVESRCNGTLGEDATTHQNAEQHRIDGRTVKLQCKVRRFDLTTGTMVPKN